MEKFLIGSSTIYGLKKKPDLEKFATQSDLFEDVKNRQTLRKPLLEKLDSALHMWFTARIAEGKPVTGSKSKSIIFKF